MIISLCASWQQVYADPATELKPFVATYMVSAMGFEGINVTNALSISSIDKQHTKYHFKSHSMPVGLLAFQKDETRDEQSEGYIADNKIRPERYNLVQFRDGAKYRDVELLFDWHKQQVDNHHKLKNSHWHMAIHNETIDKLAYQLSLMLKLANKPEQHFSLSVADGGKLKEYHFDVLGKEMLQLSSGNYQTLKVQHQRYQKNKAISLWLAPELQYLPVKIIQQEAGKPTFVSRLISYQAGTSAP